MHNSRLEASHAIICMLQVYIIQDPQGAQTYGRLAHTQVQDQIEIITSNYLKCFKYFELPYQLTHHFQNQEKGAISSRKSTIARKPRKSHQKIRLMYIVLIWKDTKHLLSAKEISPQRNLLNSHPFKEQQNRKQTSQQTDQESQRIKRKTLTIYGTTKKEGAPYHQSRLGSFSFKEASTPQSQYFPSSPPLFVFSS